MLLQLDMYDYYLWHFRLLAVEPAHHHARRLRPQHSLLAWVCVGRLAHLWSRLGSGYTSQLSLTPSLAGRKSLQTSTILYEAKCVMIPAGEWQHTSCTCASLMYTPLLSSKKWQFKTHIKLSQPKVVLSDPTGPNHAMATEKKAERQFGFQQIIVWPE